MTIMNRVLIGVALVLTLVGVGQYAMYVSLRHKLDAAEHDLAVAQADARSNKAALSAKTRAVAQAEAKAQAARKELDRALKANPEWAAAPVPDDVWRGLYPDAATAAR